MEASRYDRNLRQNVAKALKEAIMKTRKLENGLALVGALFILVAVAAAASSVFDNPPAIDFPQMNQTSTLVASF